uniref:Uncharacterized protein n=1 Tax=Moniliophthora roreri TaxID=221103 RepID=A0A0W0G1H1_MONRR
MHFSFNPSTPSTPSGLCLRIPLSDRSPIKVADNTFNPTNTSKPHRPRGPNIKHKKESHRIIVADHENDDVSTSGRPSGEETLLHSPNTVYMQTPHSGTEIVKNEKKKILGNFQKNMTTFRGVLRDVGGICLWSGHETR